MTPPNVARAPSVISLYGRLYALLDRSERRRALVVFALLFVTAFVDALGVASVMPFIAVLANPGLIETNPYLAWSHSLLGSPPRDQFFIILGFLVFAVLMVSLSLRAFSYWVQLRFVHQRNASWSARLISGYLHQPYEWFLNRHSADLATAVLAEVSQVVHGALLPALRAIAQALVSAFLLALLFLTDPMLAVAVGFGLGGGYVLFSMTYRRRLARAGEGRKLANEARFQIVQEAFGGVKDVKVGGLEEMTLRRFDPEAKNFARHQVSLGLIAVLPSFGMQGLLFGGMILILLYLLVTWGGFQQALPVAALYALAGYRLMPAIQGVYQDISELRYSAPSLVSLCTDFGTLKAPSRGQRPEGSGERRLPFQTHLELRSATYRYPGADSPALKNVSLGIPALAKVGIVGSTGSGKTTAIDLVLGLLRPQEGALVVDGVEVSDILVKDWQRSVGYVAQQIFLADDTVAANIAFGVPAGEMDMVALERAARIANLHHFVMNQLPKGYETPVGERGVRLSGGQRQRIGIARALYRDPDVLVFDEATSALDNLTEVAVMEALRDLGGRKTIILVAHRLSTVRDCDCIYLLEQGQVLAQGTYAELVSGNERFRAMAELTLGPATE